MEYKAAKYLYDVLLENLHPFYTRNYRIEIFIEKLILINAYRYNIRFYGFSLAPVYIHSVTVSSSSNNHPGVLIDLFKRTALDINRKLDLTYKPELYRLSKLLDSI